ncbi:MAG: ATP-binding protein [Candidatus Omnitrophota bacterium]|nr:ATP-binding protein [Candidatus Omnitrophota bacterium]
MGSKEELENIFDKHKKLYTAKEKLGPGLAIIQDIVNMHKGKIWAESNPKKGNRFIVELPKNIASKSCALKWIHSSSSTL